MSPARDTVSYASSEHNGIVPQSLGIVAPCGDCILSSLTRPWPSIDPAVGTTGSVVLARRPDHSIGYGYRAAERLYGVEREAALGLDYVGTFIVPEQREAIAADIQNVLGGEPTWGVEDDSLIADGTRRTLLWHVRRFEHASGEECGIVAAGMDITERQEADAAFYLACDQRTEGTPARRRSRYSGLTRRTAWRRSLGRHDAGVAGSGGNEVRLRLVGACVNAGQRRIAP